MNYVHSMWNILKFPYSTKGHPLCLFTGHVDEAFNEAFIRSFTFCLGADKLPRLSPVPVPIENILVNGGDGLVTGFQPGNPNPMASCHFTRLAHIDAPELCAVHYFRDCDNVLYHKFTGHTQHDSFHVFSRLLCFNRLIIVQSIKKLPQIH